MDRLLLLPASSSSWGIPTIARDWLQPIETRTIDVCVEYADFQDFWQAQTPGYAPTTRIIAAMDERERARLIRAVQSALPSGPNGSIAYCARANAIKARVPR